MTPQEYLASHSIKEEFVTKQFAWQLDEDNKRIVIPVYGKDKKLLWSRYRYLDGRDNKFESDTGAKVTLYPAQLIKDKDVLVFCEGEPDCVRLWQEKISAVTIQGVNSLNQNLANELSQKKIYLCLDTDEAGQKEIKDYCEKLELAGARVQIISLPREFKDVSEYFTSGKTKEDFLQLMSQAVSYDEYLMEQMKDSFPVISNEEFLKMDLPENPWLIKNIIRSRGFFVISGLGGTGKSLLALSMIKSITDGEPWLGKFECNQKCRVLILDKENDKSDLQYNMINMGVRSSNIYHVMLTAGYKTVEQNEELTNESRFLKTFVKKNKIDVVLIDSLIDVYQGSENDSVHAAKNMDFLRQIFGNIGVWAIHHEGKPGDKDVKKSPGNRMRGSTNIFNELSGQIAVSVADINHPEKLVVEHGKVRRGQKIKAFEIEMVVVDDVYHPGETKVTGFKYIKEVVLAEMAKDEARAEILNVLQAETDWVKGVDLKEMLRQKGLGKTAVEAALKELMEDGIDVEMEKRGHANYYKIGVSGTHIVVDEFIKNQDKK